MPSHVRRPKKLRALFGTLAATVESFRCDGQSVLQKVASDLFESLDTPVSLSCEILLRYGELLQLVEKTVDPSYYNDPDQFRDDYQAISFLRKVPFEVEGLDRRGTAKEKFLLAESQCRETNTRIRSFLRNPSGATRAVRDAWCIASVKIREVLGNSVSASEWLHSCRFGPGAFQHPDVRGLTSIYDKLQVSPSVTHDFRGPGAILVMSSPSWARSITGIEVDGFWPFIKETDLAPVPGNRVTFVPKTATTDRAIAIEPLINVYAQLGLGRMIRQRLKAFALIDLNDQSINQELAREGSIRGFLSTIDLSSASDTVAREVVRALLPEAWFNVMDVCRSKVGHLDGDWIRYEKFSSMGNGFTFELETLLFWALSISACEVAGSPPMVSVYGDDIVVPSSAYTTLVEVLTFFGFTLNKRKSFESGPFRESCGKDYYNGNDVRPFLQEEVPKEVKDLFVLANGLRRLASRRSPVPNRCDLRIKRAWRSVVSSLPQSVSKSCRVPAHAGDTAGLIFDWDEAQVSPFVTASRLGWEGYLGLRLNPVAQAANKVTNFEGAVASLLYRARNGFGHEYSPADPRQERDPVFKLRDGAFYGPWTDLGPWE